MLERDCATVSSATLRGHPGDGILIVSTPLRSAVSGFPLAALGNQRHATTYVSAEQPPASEETRVPLAHEDQGRTCRPRPAPGPRSPQTDRQRRASRSPSQAGLAISVARHGFGFPKSSRILRRGDFRRVYDQGSRYSCPLFAAFCLRASGEEPPADSSRIGFTVPRAVGKAVVRNRIKRRMREAVRLHLSELPVGWCIVFNPRKPAASVPFPELEAEVRKLFQRCANS